MTSPTSATARRLATGPWGRRYARHLAAECDEALADATAALEAALMRLLPRVGISPSRLFPKLTGAWVGDLYKGEAPAPNTSERRTRESRAIRAFAKRVCANSEPRLLDALSREFLSFFLGPDANA